LFQEDALGWQGNYNLLLSLLIYLDTLLLYYFVKKNQLLLQQIDTKGKSELLMVHT
jgi:hypothetical protein